MAHNAKKLAKGQALSSGRFLEPIIIIWEDHAVSHEPSWFPIEQAREFNKKAPENISVGFPVACSRKYITLAQTCGDADGTIADVIRIIRSCIVKVVKLKKCRGIKKRK